MDLTQLFIHLINPNLTPYPQKITTLATAQTVITIPKQQSAINVVRTV